LHRSGVAQGGHFEGVPEPRVIRRSEFRFDAYDPPQPVGMDPESTTPRGCKSTGRRGCCRRARAGAARSAG
jgi:hypothetical protein